MATKKKWIRKCSLLINCDNCKNEYRIYSKDFNRTISNCCSRECASNLRLEKKGKKCKMCQTVFYSRKNGKEVSHFKDKLFCSRKCSQQYHIGENSHFFIKHKVPDIRLKGDSNFKRWSNLVKKRDLFKCVNCGDGNKRHLQAHHKISVSDNSLLSFNIDNGITLCIDCHAEAHKDDPKIKALILSHYKQMKNELQRQKIA